MIGEYPMKLTRTPKHIPEGWWWKVKGKIFFNEAKP
jgi:hypothetical protein